MAGGRAPDVMRAVVLERFGGPEVLEYTEVPVHHAGEGEVLVEVHAVSVNRSLDLLVRKDGNNRPVRLPAVLGVDPTGVVVEVGEGVDNVALGERVAASANRCGTCEACLRGSGEECTSRFQLGIARWGGYAEYVNLPAWAVRAIPDELTFPDATVIMRHYPTAHRMLAGIVGLRPSEWVLVMGSAGALGSAGIEVARGLGANVIAGAGADERVAAAMKCGAQWGVNYRAEDLEAEVARITSGHGVDVVFENVGDPELFPKAFACLAPHGRLVTAGSHGGASVPLDVRRLYNRRITIYGTAGTTPEDIEWALEAGRAGALHPFIGALLPLSEASRAHRMAEGYEVLGKVVLDPTAD